MQSYSKSGQNEITSGVHTWILPAVSFRLYSQLETLANPQLAPVPSFIRDCQLTHVRSSSQCKSHYCCTSIPELRSMTLWLQPRFTSPHACFASASSALIESLLPSNLTAFAYNQHGGERKYVSGRIKSTQTRTPSFPRVRSLR